MGAVSDDVWSDWEGTGKKEYMKTLSGYLTNSETTVGNEHWTEINRMVYDLIWRGIRGQLKSEYVVGCVGEMIVLKTELANVVVDIIALADTETQVEDGKKDDRSRLTAIVRDVNKFLSDGLVKERLEFDLMGEAGIVKNPKKFFNTVIKLKTKLFYKQQKFNLFREESEGYAKLITELNQDLSTVSKPYMLEVIKSLIGYFNLDPNRVLDIILESFESQPKEFLFFIGLLTEFLPDRVTLKELLHFKFSYFVDNTEDETTPNSFYQLTALLIQHGILPMEDVYPWLSPADEDIEAAAAKEELEAKEYLRKINIVSTKSQDDKDDDKDGRRKEKDPNHNNQKIGLLAALFKVGAWSLGEEMLRRLPLNYCIAQPKVSLALSDLIHKTMDPVYHLYSGLCKRVRSKHYTHLPGAICPPVAETLDDLRNHVIPMLRTLGPYAHRDPVLIIKLLRILKSALGLRGNTTYETEGPKKQDLSSKPFYYDAMTLLDEVFLPSLALLHANCCLAEEIWSLIRNFPYEHRYRLYDQWKGDSLTEHPILIRGKAKTFEAIKRIMKQMSKENVKHTGRQLGKLSHSSPGLIFAYVLSQIQVADNLIGPVVDSMKYMTNLSFDVLGFCIIESLNHPDKNRTKTDGTSISMWLGNLAVFCGSVFKKYPIELTGLLQYVANQLKAKHSLDLLIVKEVVNKMGGIEAYEEMTPEQLEAISGGELLRQEAGNFMQVKNTRKSSQRLKDCLIEMDMAVPLVLLMAQQGSCVVYQETEKDHLKLVGKLFDQCHDTLVQFASFLATNLSQDDYAKSMPPLPQLLSKFYVNPDIAFCLARPMFNHQITTQFEELRKADKQWKGKTTQEKQSKHAEAARLIMEPLTAAVMPVYPSKIWDDISPQLLSTFWSLTMYDLYVPERIYQKKIKDLKEAPDKLKDNKDLNSARRKKEAERLNTLMEKLQEEEKRHKEHVERVMVRLRQEKDNWFFARSAKTAKNETITQFLQFCLFPRSIFTASDASYAAKFVEIIHSLKTPNFSTLICFDRTFCDITYTVTSCTENEASRYGRFLSSMLETASKWHKNKDIFEAECSGHPGFITKWKASNDETTGSDKTHSDTVDFENYRHVCHKWHYKIAKALVVCLESKDYVQIRNALIILNEIIDQYPLISNLASVLEKRIEKVCEEEKEKRKDLYIKACSYRGKLQRCKGRMIKEQDFHIVKRSKNEKEEKEEEKAKEETKEKKKEDRKSESRERGSKSKERERGSKSKERERSTKSRDRGSESRERTEMGPPASRDSSRKSADPGDSDRDFKRKRDSNKEKEKEKSPVLDRLQKKEQAKAKKDKEEKEKSKKSKDSKDDKDKDKEKEKKERKRDRDTSSEVEKKKRKEDALTVKQNGDTATTKRKARR